MKSSLSRCLIVLLLLSNTACARQVSDARVGFILGGDHGWIDLALLSGPNAPAKACNLTVAIGGEQMLLVETLVPQAGAGPIATGYRLPVPVGKTTLTLTRSGCDADVPNVELPLAIQKNHLTRIEFDGKTLALTSTVPFEPTTLEWVRDEVLKLQAQDRSAAQSLDKLATIGQAILGINALLLLGVAALWLRRR